MQANNFPVKPLGVTPEQLAMIGGPNTVYVREMGASEVAGIEVPEGTTVPEGIKLYSVHLMDGTRVAVVDSRDAAFAAAVQNEMVPVSVH